MKIRQKIRPNGNHLLIVQFEDSVNSWTSNLTWAPKISELKRILIEMFKFEYINNGRRGDVTITNCETFYDAEKEAFDELLGDAIPTEVIMPNGYHLLTLSKNHDKKFWIEKVAQEAGVKPEESNLKLFKLFR